MAEKINGPADRCKTEESKWATVSELAVDWYFANPMIGTRYFECNAIDVTLPPVQLVLVPEGALAFLDASPI